MTTVPEKLLEPLEGGKIREKLRATCMSRSRKTEDDQKRGPLMVKYPEGVPQIKKTIVQENFVSVISMTNKRSCRTPSPPRSCSKSSTNLTKLASSPALNLLCPDKPHTEAVISSKGINQPCSQPSSPGPILRCPIKAKPVPRPPSPSMHMNERRASSPTSGPNHELMEKIREQISKVQRAKLYLLRQLGPCSFLIVGDLPDQNYKVIIGPQTCTCDRGPYCIHVLFVMLRVLQIKETDVRLFSKRLKNYEVEDLVRKYQQRKKRRLTNATPRVEDKLLPRPAVIIRNRKFRSESSIPEAASLEKQRMEEASICPICLLEMLKEENVVSCEKGCHNKLHQHCIAIWAAECQRQNEPILCPLCRSEWVFSSDSSQSEKSPSSAVNKTTELRVIQGRQSNEEENAKLLSNLSSQHSSNQALENTDNTESQHLSLYSPEPSSEDTRNATCQHHPSVSHLINVPIQHLHNTTSQKSSCVLSEYTPILLPHHSSNLSQQLLNTSSNHSPNPPPHHSSNSAFQHISHISKCSPSPPFEKCHNSPFHYPFSPSSNPSLQHHPNAVSRSLCIAPTYLTSSVRLPRTKSLTPTKLKQAQPWIKIFGQELVCCLMSDSWTVRETAVRRLTQEVKSHLALSQENPDPGGTFLGENSEGHSCWSEITVMTCCNILTSMISDPVYKVYVVCLRCLRAILAYSECKSEETIRWLQNMVEPVVKAILLKCADSNRKTRQLSIATIMELGRGQAGALAVSTHTHISDHKSLGGVPFVLKCILETSPSYSVPRSWQWALGRLLVSKRLMDEFPQEFLPHCEEPRNQFDRKCNLRMKNCELLISTLEFAVNVFHHPHITVVRVAEQVFLIGAQLCLQISPIFSQVCQMLSRVNPNLQQHLRKKLRVVVLNTNFGCKKEMYGTYLSSSVLSTTSKTSRKQKMLWGKWSSLPDLNIQQERTLVTNKLVFEEDQHLSSNVSSFQKIVKSVSHSPLRTRKSCENVYSFSPLSRCQSLFSVKDSTKRSTYKLPRPRYLPIPNTTSNTLVDGSPLHHIKGDLQLNSTTPKASEPPTLVPVTCSFVYSGTCECEQTIKFTGSYGHSTNKSTTFTSLSKSHQNIPRDLIDLSPTLLSTNITPNSCTPVSFQSEVTTPTTPMTTPSMVATSQGLPVSSGGFYLSKKILELGKGIEAKEFISECDKNSPVDKVIIEFHTNDIQKHTGVYTEDLHWKKGPLLGRGAFSYCYQARDIKTGALMAVKQVPFSRKLEQEQEKAVEDINKEISMMSKLCHPNVLRILGAICQGACYNVFIEWMAGGSVASLLEHYGPFSEDVIVKYTQQVLAGLAYLHDNQILHRDLKGANLLVDSKGHHLKIADFGASARLISHATVAGEFQGQLLGTVAFMAPEVLRGENYGRSCDVWSVGCVLIEMATTKPPWDASNFSNHLALIFKIASSTEPPVIPTYLSDVTQNLALQCLEVKSDKRASAKELLNHLCFTQQVKTS